MKATNFRTTAVVIALFFSVPSAFASFNRRNYSVAARFTVLVILWALALSPLRGGVGVWTTHGPDDGRRRVTALAIDPRDHSILYAATQVGVLKSVDDGVSWSATGLTPAVSALSISRSGVLCAVTSTDTGSGERVLISRDGAETWTPRGSAGLGSVSRAASDLDGGVLYVATRTGFLRSDGEGKDFHPSNTGLSDLDVISLVVNPDDSNVIYAGTFNEGVFKSSDGGAKWTPSSNGLANTLVFDLALDPSDSKTIYAGTGSRYINGVNRGGGVFKSTNGGESWESLGLSAMFVISVAIDPADRRTIYAGTSGLGMYKTVDGGSHWISLPDGKIDHDDDFTDFFVIDRAQPSVVYAGSWGGLMQTSDGGRTWLRVHGLMNSDIDAVAADPSAPGHVLAGNWKSFVVTNDGGASWKAVDQVGYRPVEVLAFDPSNPENVFLGSYTVQKSTDGGKTWHVSAAGIPPPPDPLGDDFSEPHAFAIDRRNSSVLFLATSVGLFKSVDGGANWFWSSTGIGTSNVMSVAIDAFDSSTVYAFADRASVVKSVDGGSTWWQAGSGLPAIHDLRIAVDPLSPGVIYAGGSDGFFTSRDNAASWRRSDGFPAGEPISTIAVDASTAHRLYAGTAGAGVFRSDDGGSTWAAYNAGLTNLDVRELAIHPSGEYLYAATAAGVFDIEMTSDNTPPVAPKGEPNVIAGCGDIRSRVAEFRALLGPLNHGRPIRGSGRREWNWDKMSPVNRDFTADASQTGEEGFSIAQPPLIRVSDNDFADVNPKYAAQFHTFSSPNALAPVGTNIVDLKFAVRGLLGPDDDGGFSSYATVNGFGIVFSDVDLAGAASIELFADQNMQQSLGEFAAPVRCDASGLSFVGVVLSSGQRISAVRVKSGQAPIGALVDDISDGGSADLVVIDDLFYGEPIPGDEVISASLQGIDDEDTFNELPFGGFAVLSRDRRGGPVMFSIVMDGVTAGPSTVHVRIRSRGEYAADFVATLIDGRAAGSTNAITDTLWHQMVEQRDAFPLLITMPDGTEGQGLLHGGSPAPVRLAIPVAGHLRTANGALLETEVRLINRQGLPADALLQFYPSDDPLGAPRQATVSIARGQQLVLPDIVGELFALEGIGALQISSAQPLMVGTRIYDANAGYATPGQFVPALPRESASRSAALPGLSPPGARTNIGWFNPSEVPANVTFSAFDASGARLSSATRRLDPNAQLQIPSTSLFTDLPAAENFYVVFNSDIPLFVYASVIDNASGDTSFIPAQDSAASWVVPSVVRVPVDTGQTDVQILNVGDARADVSVEYFGTGKPAKIDVVVEPHQQKELTDLWTDVQGRGGLKITASRPVAVTSRTRLGTLGRTVPAVRTSNVLTSEGTLPLVTAHSSDERGRFVTSIGWFNPSAAAAWVYFTLHSATGEPVAWYYKKVDPFEQTESSDLFSGHVSPDSYVTFACAGSTTVYGSILDMRSGASMIIQPSLDVAPVVQEKPGSVTYLHGTVFDRSTLNWAQNSQVVILDGPQAGASWSALDDPLDDVYIIRGLTSGLTVTVRASAPGYESQVRRVYLTAPYASFDFRLQAIR